MNKKDVLGTVQIAGGTYIGYQTLKHGLPRAVGVRIEYHTTTNENAKLIKQSGNILDPRLGGRNGFSQLVSNEAFITNSKQYVHITGLHKNSNLFASSKFIRKFEDFKPVVRTVGRKASNFLYKIVGNGRYNNLKINYRATVFDKAKILLKEFLHVTFNNKTKRFCVPGTDSYFNNEFITDIKDPMASKSSKALRVYNNRFSAMLGGLKKFGLKGMKENKCRVLVGAGSLATGGFVGYNLIHKGIKNIYKN